MHLDEFLTVEHQLKISWVDYLALFPLAGGFVSVFIPALAPALRVRALLPDPTVRGQ